MRRATPPTSPVSCSSASTADGEQVLDLPQGVSLPTAEQALDANPAVDYAVPNYVAHASGDPERPRSRRESPAAGSGRSGTSCRAARSAASLPAQYQARGGLNAPEAWDILKQRGAAGGKGARVAVLDTGIAYMTKKPQFRTSPDFSRHQFLPGYDFVDKDKHAARRGRPRHPRRRHDRRAGQQRVGLTGLRPRAKIMPVRVLDSEGFGTARDIAKGIRFAATHKAQVINMSFEFSLGVNSCAKIKGICSAIKYAFKKGALVVGGGRERERRARRLPGRRAPCDRRRADHEGRLPGERLPDRARDSTWWRPAAASRCSPTAAATTPCSPAACRSSSSPSSGRGFTTFGYPGGYEGTSMAAAHVSGVAAMVIAQPRGRQLSDRRRVPARGHRPPHRFPARPAV